jgi:hypothetical protein
MARTHTRTPAVRLARWRGNIAVIAQSLSSAKAADACDLSSNFVFGVFAATAQRSDLKTCCTTNLYGQHIQRKENIRQKQIQCMDAVLLLTPSNHFNLWLHTSVYLSRGEISFFVFIKFLKKRKEKKCTVDTFAYGAGSSCHPR